VLRRGRAANRSVTRIEVTRPKLTALFREDSVDPMARIDSGIPVVVQNRALHRLCAVSACVWLTQFGRDHMSPEAASHALGSLQLRRQPSYAARQELHRIVTSDGSGYEWQEALGLIKNKLGRTFEASLLLPRNGDSRGLTTVLAEGIELGAVLSCRSAQGTVWLIPENSVDDTMTWMFRTESVPFSPLAHGDLAEADRALRRAVLQTEDRLHELDLIPRHGPGRDFVQADTQGWESLQWPSTVDSAQRLLAIRAARLITSVEAAHHDDGGARSSGELRQRHAVLNDLDMAARRALEISLIPAMRSH
jgi:hypothetical protein